MSVSVRFSVEIVNATAEAVQRTRVELTAVSPTVGDALAAAGIARDADVGLWGKRVAPETALTEGDRIELYRPLIADPKLARLQRASEQGYRWQGRTRRAARTAALNATASDDGNTG